MLYLDAVPIMALLNSCYHHGFLRYFYNTIQLHLSYGDENSDSIQTNKASLSTGSISSSSSTYVSDLFYAWYDKLFKRPTADISSSTLSNKSANTNSKGDGHVLYDQSGDKYKCSKCCGKLMFPR